MSETREAEGTHVPGYLAARAGRALQPALSYFKAFMDAQARPWSSKDPEGNIICTVAENKLSSDVLQARLQTLGADMPLSVLNYPRSFRGTPEAREAYARVLSRTFMSGVDVDPQHLALLNGAGSVLETLFWCITGPRSGVLLPKPIYPAFLNDLQVKADLEVVLFNLDESGDVAAQLDIAAQGAAAAGHPIKALLFANPTNPLGTIYSRSTVLAMIRWCLKNRVHCVSDEIYALSVWGEGVPAFQSAEVLVREEASSLPQEEAALIPDLVHVVFGLSKDFCASGLRVGGLHTRNSTLMAAIDNLAYFQGCSNQTLWCLTQILNDDAFIDGFLEENRRRMRQAYNMLAEALDNTGIPHVRAVAAMFAWIDLRAGLKQPTWEGEDELWHTLVYDYGVLLSPGKACKADEPGFFRVCWAWVDPQALPVAVARIKKLLDSRTTANQG